MGLFQTSKESFPQETFGQDHTHIIFHLFSYKRTEGVAWKTHFGAHRKSDGAFMDFFAYSFIRTNEYGEITHWETHVNPAYNDFLEIAIGEHGPYDDANKYMAAVMKKLKSAGIDLAALAHKSRKI